MKLMVDFSTLYGGHLQADKLAEFPCLGSRLSDLTWSTGNLSMSVPLRPGDGDLLRDRLDQTGIVLGNATGQDPTHPKSMKVFYIQYKKDLLSL